MRRVTTAITAAALALSMALSVNAGTAQAAPAGYDSAYQFESAFLTLRPADSGTFSVFFANTGSASWVAGSGTQVNLSVCSSDKVTCNVSSANAAWANGWLSSTAYATATKSVVVPGDFSAFTYNVKVPAGTAAGTYRFNGDLVLASTGERVHPEGYFQDATVTGAGPAALSASPDFSVDEANKVSSTVPGSGQHTYTFQASGLAGTLTFAILPSGNATRNSDGSYSFCDTNQDSKADLATSSASRFTAVNGTSITPSNTIINQAIPANGTITVTLDSDTNDQRVRVVGWQDLNNNGGVDLTGAGDTNCDAFTAYNATSDGAIAVSARKFYTGDNGVFGSAFGGACVAVYRHSGSLQMFTAGTTTGLGGDSRRFNYDSNDIFRVNGVQVTLAQFKSAMTPSSTGAGDKVTASYNPDPAGISEFNICSNAGAQAPIDVSVAIGNFDNGTSAEDARITFTAPSTNSVTSYTIQRSGPTTGACTNPTPPTTSDSGGTPAGSTFTTVGGISVDAGKQGTFTNYDLANGTWCYRVTVQDPITAVISYSNYAATPCAIGACTGDVIRPTSTSTVLTTSGGFANTLDAGDKFTVTFSEAMSVAANAVIRVTDRDCGNTTPGGTCANNNTNTVGDVICGTNATCTLDTAKTTLTVTLTANPSIVAAGSVSGVGIPADVSDSSGITDLSGNTWDLPSSADRTIN